MTARAVDPSAEGLKEAAHLLRLGEVVGVPTETVYGLAGLASDERAVARIFAIKERPTFDPLIVHVADAKTLKDLAGLGVVAPEPLSPEGNARAELLMGALWPGPLTLVLPRGRRVVDLVSSGLDTVAVRMPDHAVTRALIREVGPLAAPSANRFGRISPTRAADVLAELGDRLPLVIDGGPCGLGVESTVVSLVGAPTLLRPGGTPRERIERLLGLRLAAPQAGAAAMGPGMLSSHYAPRAPLALWTPGSPFPLPQLPHAHARRLGVLLYSAASRPAALRELGERNAAQTVLRILSAGGEPEEAARNLFRSLRELDDQTDFIIAERCPVPDGLGPAIEDRLSRAAGRT